MWGFFYFLLQRNLLQYFLSLLKLSTMKKYYFVIFILFIVTTVSSQIINFPDVNFKTKLLEADVSNQIAKNLGGSYFKIDANNNGEIETTEALQVSYLNVGESMIGSLNGISNFTGLLTLRCYNNNLTTLDVTALSNLKTLQCLANQLNLINVSGLINLENLSCQNNQLTTLNVTGLYNLRDLSCSNNQLTALDVFTCISLQRISCSYNQIEELYLNHLLQLSTLVADNNHLTTLCIKNGRIQSITATGLSGNPNLSYVCIDSSEIGIAGWIANHYPNCTVNTYCSFTPGGDFYTIQGNSRYDENNNGCNSSDSVYPNLKLAVTSGVTSQNCIANNSGNYAVNVLSGTHTIAPVLENPSYFTVSPTVQTITFPTATSPYIQNFCVSPNGIHNDLEMTIMTMQYAHPNLNAWYVIVYKNKGTHTQSGTVNLAFDDAVLDYVSSNAVISNQVPNSLTWNYTNLLPFESRTILVTMHLNSSTATPPLNFGDILNYTATISGAVDETPIDNISVLNQTVTNSFDPNNKTCLEGSTVSPDKVGDYVHYIIRFENNGTANAQNIVVKDIIDTSKYDVSSLIPITGSHSFETRITQTNNVEFIFENINLPFDDANNDGYVAFKIKTKSTLVVGNSFSNTASIYFDYNAPIVTNTATTTIQALANPDFEFDTYFSIAPNPVKDILNIQVKNSVEISSLSIYNTLGQLVLVVTEPTSSIDVSSLKTGNYFIKVISDKGSSSSKFIKK